MARFRNAVRAVTGDLTLRLWCGALLLALVATGWLWFENTRSDKVEEARPEAIAAVQTQVAEVLSYDHRSVEDDLASAATHLTGDFKDEFAKLTAELIVPAAHSKQISTQAEVTAVGIVKSTADTATTLVFVTQTTTSKGQKESKIDGSRLVVTLKKVGGDWLISALDPV